MKLRVIKLGGSLLHSPDLLNRVLRWNSSLEPRKNYWVIGGGARVDSIRKKQDDENLSNEDCHWAAINVMQANATAFHAEMSQHGNHWPLVERFDDTRVDAASEASGPDFENSIVLPLRGVRAANLPIGWNVTSDSIAAAFAIAGQVLDKQIELVLLKSTPVNGNDVEHWADQGWVDQYFPVASKGLRTIHATQLPNS